jgi:DNA repair protein RadB
MRVSTGAKFLDIFLEGGYEQGVVTTVYGPSGSGKSNLCVLASVETASLGKKVLFLDTEGGIAVERMRQVCSNHQEVLGRIVFLNLLDFEGQKLSFGKLKEAVDEEVGLVVVDSISMLYRLELGQSEEVYEVNAALGKQIATLVEIARSRKIPVLVTTQVYADFENKDRVKIVGGDLLKYGSKCLIELQKSDLGRSLVLRKHRSMPEGKEIKFKIVEGGLEKA